jgi:hypothetical protein
MPTAFATSAKKLGIALVRLGQDGTPGEFHHPQNAGVWGPFLAEMVMPMKLGVAPNESMQALYYEVPDDSECAVALYELVDGQPPKLLRRSTSARSIARGRLDRERR